MFCSRSELPFARSSDELRLSDYTQQEWRSDAKHHNKKDPTLDGGGLKAAPALAASSIKPKEMGYEQEAVESTERKK